MSEKASDPIIELENVCVDIPLRGLKNIQNNDDPRVRRLKNGNYVLRALDNISLSVAKGGRLGVVGGNGNGKTTLLRLVAGLLPIHSGSIKVNGSIRALLSISAGVFPTLTGRQNSKLFYSLLDVQSMSLPAFIDDVEHFSELGTFFDMPITTYSPGMRSRLQFAMNTIEPADILLMDEWMGVADQKFQEKAKQRLVNYISKNGAFLFTSHNPKLLKRMTDRQVEMKLGKLIELKED